MPVEHQELNPIELVWSNIKSAAENSNFAFKSEALEHLDRTKMESFGPELLTKFCEHANEIKFYLIFLGYTVTLHESANTEEPTMRNAKIQPAIYPSSG